MQIGEVSKMTGLSCHALRYYEQIGLVRNVERVGSGKRNYSEGTVKWILFLVSLRNTGMPLSDIIRYAEMYFGGDQSIPKRIELLSSYRDKLAEEAKRIQTSLDFLQNKIEFYQNKYRSDQSSCL